MARVIDRASGLDRIILNARRLDYREIHVGIQKGEKGVDGTAVAEYATHNEFGTEDIPERPFMRQAIDTNKDNILAVAGDLTQHALCSYGNVNKALKQVGEYIAGKIKNEITAGDFTANSPKTIAMKGSEQPLIDSGTMRKSITYKVV